MTTERITCPRCGNANSFQATECLACSHRLEFIASRDLPPDDLAHFTRQVVNDFKRARRGLNAARYAREIAEDRAASWLQSLNQTKAYAMKHGIELE